MGQRKDPPRYGNTSKPTSEYFVTSLTTRPEIFLRTVPYAVGDLKIQRASSQR